MGLMKLKTRLAVAFLTITIVPMMLFYLMAMVLGNYQAKSFIKEYGLTEPVDFFSGNSMQIFNRLTKRSQISAGHWIRIPESTAIRTIWIPLMRN